MTREFKSFLKLPGGGEIQRCYYPFKLDTYGCGCSNNCLYCYARSCLDFRGLWDDKSPAVADFGKVKKYFYDVLERGKDLKFAGLLRQRVPLRLGGMTDCFGDVEEAHGVTLKLLKLLKEYHYPYLILTKNARVASDKYLEVLDPRLAYVQLSVTSYRDDLAATYEPGASVTSDRLDAAEKLHYEGYHTAVRINPLFPIYPDGHFSGGNLFSTDDKFDYFNWCLLDMIANARVNTVIAGFLRLSAWNIKWIREFAGRDLTVLFSPSEKHKNAALHFSIEEKRYYYEEMRRLCHARGMDFSVCYDGDEAYEEFRYLWANPHDCCNGVGKVDAFNTTFNFEAPTGAPLETERR